MAANLRIINANLVDTATVSASSSASVSLGVANLLTDIKSAVWRSIGTTARLDVLLASAAIIGGIALPFTNLSSAATIRVRASNEVTATNLLAYPRNFDNAVWTRFGTVDVIPNVGMGSDGTLTADQVNFISAGSGIYQAVAVNALTTYTLSIDIEAVVAGPVKIIINTNLGDPVTVVVNATTTRKRYSVTKTTAAGATSISAQIQDNGAGAAGFKLWHAQLEVGPVATSIIPDGTAFISRASKKNVFNAAGALVEVAANAPAYDYDPATQVSRGLSLEAAATNGVTNSTAQGAVVGVPGTLPSGWIVSTVAGLARSVAGIVTENGMECIDLRFSGTPTATSNVSIVFESMVAAGTGQSWANSAFCKVVAGVAPNFFLTVHEFDASTTFLRSGDVWRSLGSTLARLQQKIVTGAATAFVRPVCFFGTANGVPMDFTLRISLPQLEQGAYATSPIKTANSAVTRAADVSTSPQVTRQVGYIDTWQSYDYDSGYVTACPGGVRNVWGWAPAQLNVASYGFGGGSCARRWVAKMTARAIAIDISDPGNAMGYIEASRLVIGDYWSPQKNADYGAQQTPVDNSTHDRSDAGDQRVIPGSQFDGMKFNMQWLAPDDRAAFAKILRRNGTRVPMFVSLFPDSADAAIEADFQIYGRLPSLGELTAHMYGYHSAPLTIEQI